MSTVSPPATPLRQDVQVIGLVSLAHAVSHFAQLMLPPLFPWLKDAFNVSYTQLGFVLTVYFVVSCAVQAISGFIVDRRGPLPVLFGGLVLIVLSILGYAAAPSYAALLVCAIVAGIGNGVFHPVDFTLLNGKVFHGRLGHAYSTHGLSGGLGWAVAPALLVPVAVSHGWRAALLAGASVAAAVLLIVWLRRQTLALDATPQAGAKAADPSQTADSDTFGFLRLPAVWMCFGFFLFYAAVMSVVQTYAPEAARQLHAVPVALAAACLSIFMACSAVGSIWGGFLAKDAVRCERIVAMAFSIAAALALVIGLVDLPAWAVPVLFGLMGAATGVSTPSRDLLVKRSTPEGSTGRVYGVVYAGLDIGQALAPLIFGALMDGHRYQAVWLGLAAVQLVLIGNAVNVRKARRTPLAQTVTAA